MAALTIPPCVVPAIKCILARRPSCSTDLQAGSCQRRKSCCDDFHARKQSCPNQNEAYISCTRGEKPLHEHYIDKESMKTVNLVLIARNAVMRSASLDISKTTRNWSTKIFISMATVVSYFWLVAFWLLTFKGRVPPQGSLLNNVFHIRIVHDTWYLFGYYEG